MATEDHILTITDDGHWNCSCGQWGDALLGPIGKNLTEELVRKHHRSHANAIVINLDNPGTSELQELQDLVHIYNKKSNELQDLRHKITALRGTTTPCCFGEDDCSISVLIECPWSMDCGEE